jgi:hypothetical protein
MYLFGNDENGWCIKENGKFSYGIKKPAICFSYHPELGPIRATLLKFGEAERVKSYFEMTYKRYLNAGLELEAEELVYMEFDNCFDVNELNKCIENTGYVALLYERSMSNGVEPGTIA